MTPVPSFPANSLLPAITFSGAINFMFWVTRVTDWIYRRTDQIPIRIQQNVDREYQAINDAELEVKDDVADSKVMVFTAQQFPDFFVKKYILPYEKHSELWKENTAFLAYCNRDYYVDHHDKLELGSLLDLKNPADTSRGRGLQGDRDQNSSHN
jgi:hypothetical protein